ncbi:ribonuclease P protein component [Flavobacteriaceae bacterium]|jgi:ribonuclease P protein component|nr:ribonuclease P protein component [Flavobacteriaceae bacterium]MDA9622321.1 ribonuclease P protein component [Flavobacteriaceae bacterium]MDB9976227.1 ribonuclease P protein component [Flavobacteriaceae bacterium]|tara:strand:+ start:172 stop:513 length:342 start_codon:yes stop_codon:yes gene_type:complete
MFLFNKKNSLKNKKDIENLFKNGKPCSHKFLRTIYLPSESFLKIGISVPKKLVPLAVKRNLIKRRIKEQIRLLPSALLEKKDGFLFVLFHGKKEVSSKEISECLNDLILKTFH